MANPVLKKAEFAAKVAEKLGLSQKDAQVAIDGVFGSIADALKEEKTIVVGDVGRLTTLDKPAGTARNPRTGEAIAVPAKTVVKFKQTKGFVVK